MRRSILLILSVALAVLVFAPITAAQSDDMGADDRGMNARGTDDRGMHGGGMDDRGIHVRGMHDRGFDDRGMDDATASPASSASASAMGGASASATPSATSSASASATPTSSATASPSSELPDTGGFSLAPVLSAAVLTLLIGSGVIATVLVRRTS